MKTFDARRELARQKQPFATQFGKYELQFQPHLLGSMILVTSRARDEFCGTWLLSDAPAGFVVALGSALVRLREVRL